jgi:hypothetical protein
MPQDKLHRDLYITVFFASHKKEAAVSKLSIVTLNLFQGLTMHQNKFRRDLFVFVDPFRPLDSTYLPTKAS